MRLLNDNEKRPEPQDIQLRVSKISAFYQKISQGASALGESAAGSYLSLRIHLKSQFWNPSSPKGCFNFTQWFMEEHSCTIVITLLGSVSKLHANTSSPYLYWRKRPKRLAHLELCHKNPDTLEIVLNRIALSNSTVEKCAPMQVVKKTEQGRASGIKEQKCPSFQTNYD